MTKELDWDFNDLPALIEEESGILPQKDFDIMRSLEVEMAALRDVDAMLETQAPKGAAREERAERNAIIREQLAADTDLVVAWAYTKGINLAEKELLKRFQEERAVPLMPLIYYWHNVKPQGETKYDWKIFNLINNDIPRYAPIAPQAEMVRLVERFYGVRSECFITPTLSWRDDLQEITNRVIERISPKIPTDSYWGGKTQLEDTMQYYKIGAIELKNQREGR